MLGVDMKPPPGVNLTWLSASQTFDIMLDRGEIDAAYGFAPHHDPKLFKLNMDRYGGTPIEGNPRMKKMFADGGRAVVEAYFKKTGIVPANHVIIAQERVLHENPWLAAELFRLFSESKRAAYERTNFTHPAYLYFESYNRNGQADLFGEDPFPYGVSKNRPMLETLFANSHAEGLTRKLAKIEEVFSPTLLDT
jgi:4,5-dihydroxyphthalate decarboxylase